MKTFPYEELYRLCADNQEVEANSMVLNYMEEIHCEFTDIMPKIAKEFHPEILKTVDISKLAISTILCFLDCTQDMKETESRIAFYQAAEKTLLKSVGEQRTRSFLRRY